MYYTGKRSTTFKSVTLKYYILLLCIIFNKMNKSVQKTIMLV